MSTFVTSKGTRGQHVSPKWTSQPYRQNPGRREHIHGKIQPADKLVRMGRRIPSGKIAVALALIIALLFAMQFGRLI